MTARVKQNAGARTNLSSFPSLPHLPPPLKRQTGHAVRNDLACPVSESVLHIPQTYIPGHIRDQALPWNVLRLRQHVPTALLVL